MTDKFTDEQLREMLADQDKRSYGDEGRLDPYVASDLLTELIALRAERAKPTQSDEAILAGARRGETIAILALICEYEKLRHALASISAEVSAERAKLEAALREARRFVDYFANDHREFVGPGTPTSCLAHIDWALNPDAPASRPAGGGAAKGEDRDAQDIFTTMDYSDLAKTLRLDADKPYLSAVMSNNFNLILGALDVAAIAQPAESGATERPRDKTDDWDFTHAKRRVIEQTEHGFVARDRVAKP